jgi:uncharacterized protein with PIN domain
MLKKMGKFLRIMGIDTIIATNLDSDNVIIQQALNENRILVTMDKLMYQRIAKLSSKAILIDVSDLESQIVQFFRKNQLKLTIEDIIEPVSFNSRCSMCNSTINSISKEIIVNRIPKETFAIFDQFWICSNESCKKIYWLGSHWKNIERTINRIKLRLSKDFPNEK